MNGDTVCCSGCDEQPKSLVFSSRDVLIGRITATAATACCSGRGENPSGPYLHFRMRVPVCEYLRGGFDVGVMAYIFDPRICRSPRVRGVSLGERGK